MQNNNPRLVGIWLKGFGTGAGVVVTILLLALSSVNVAASAAMSYHGDHVIFGNTGFDFSGCGRADKPQATMSAVTGTGHADMKTHAATCSAANGGPAISSYGADSVQFGLMHSMKLAKAINYVNSSWNITLAASVNATGKVTKCPYTSTHYQFNLSAGVEWYNTTQQFCYSEAFIEVVPQVEICDWTQNLCADTGFGAAYIVAGSYAENYSISYNFSSPSVGTNSSYSCTTCWGSLGTGGLASYSFNTNQSAVQFWPAGDSVTLSATLFMYAVSEVQNAKGAHDEAVIDDSLPHYHTNLLSFTWK
ncbi:MAG: hypothetical protein L3J96_00545 [Thermoplasmata archaeon]|nr:hypothetical protein [Thermoplasmata archaeon]